MIKNWLKIAFINYKKSWLSTIINLLGLSLGLCIFLMVFIHWQDEKSYEQWIPNKENIYLVENSNSVFGNMVVSSFPALAVSKEKFKEIDTDYRNNPMGRIKATVPAEKLTQQMPDGKTLEQKIKEQEEQMKTMLKETTIKIEE